MGEPEIGSAAGSIAAGSRIAGKYIVERVIGRGGMGIVLAARHLALDQEFAIKVLLPEARQDPRAVDRFLREARLAAKLTSDHVVRVTDVGILDDGAAFMVMELLEGHDLEVELADRGPLPMEEDAVDFVLQAIDAIAEAHAVGVVHRDLKPSNLFVVRRPGRRSIIKVLDFGISKLTGSGSSEGAGITRSNSIIGSPAYMSPEQARSSKTVDGRSDVWALGVILYELLAGKPPFWADSIGDLFVAILHGDIPPIPRSDADVPPEVRAAIARALERDRDRRFATAADFALALAPFGSGQYAACVERARAIAQGTLVVSRPGEGRSRDSLPGDSGSRERLPVESGARRSGSAASRPGEKSRPDSAQSGAPSGLTATSQAGWDHKGTGAVTGASSTVKPATPKRLSGKATLAVIVACLLAVSGIVTAAVLRQSSGRLTGAAAASPVPHAPEAPHADAVRANPSLPAAPPTATLPASLLAAAPAERGPGVDGATASSDGGAAPSTPDRSARPSPPRTGGVVSKRAPRPSDGLQAATAPEPRAGKAATVTGADASELKGPALAPAPPSSRRKIEEDNPYHR